MTTKLEDDFSKKGYVISKTKEQKALLYLQEKVLNFIISSDKNANISLSKKF